MTDSLVKESLAMNAVRWSFAYGMLAGLFFGIICGLGIAVLMIH